MYIGHLKLTNFRLFKKFEADFNNRVTVIVGVNGAGKSTILDALAIAAGTFLVGFDGIRGRSITREDATNISYTMADTIDLQAQYPVVIEAEGTVGGQQMTWTRQLNGSEGKTTISGAKNIVDISRAYQTRIRKGDTSLILPVLSYYGTGRLWAQKKTTNSQISGRSTRLNGYRDCLSAASNEKLMMNWFMKMALREFQSRKEGSVNELNAVYKAVEKCCQKLTGWKNIRVQYNSDTNELDILNLSDRQNGQRYPMHELSDGYKNTISMISDIAYRMTVLNPQLTDPVAETPGIVMIDEVDLHLHPQWQQIIIGMLTEIFPKVQFIVTTHAPSVIASVKRENMLLISSDNKNGIQPSTEVYGRTPDTILSSVMDTHDRPQEIRKLFQKCYAAIDDERLDDAEKILADIENLIGADDPEAAGLHTTIRFERM